MEGNESLKQQTVVQTGKAKSARKGLKVHACFCGKTFTRAEHLRRHQVNHDENYRFVCPFPGCGRPFHRQDLFKKHQIRHTGSSAQPDSQSIPGYSLVPIRIFKQNDLMSRKPNLTGEESNHEKISFGLSHLETREACLTHNDASSAPPLPYDDELVAYTAVLDFESKNSWKRIDQKLWTVMTWPSYFGELKKKSNPINGPVYVDRSIGWNVDPFFKMPEFADGRINTQHVYQHCLQVLGRVGKSPCWIEKILNNRVGFLSSLLVAVSHLDVVRGADTESVVALAAKSEVMCLIRDSTTDGKIRFSDMTIMSICQLLSSEIVYGELTVLTTHIRGIESIIRTRGGPGKVGWDDEIAAVVGGKTMLISAHHDLACPEIFENLTYSLTPNFPNVGTVVPESPTYWVSSGLKKLRGVEHCSSATHKLLRDMQQLTEAFFIHHGVTTNTSTAAESLPLANFLELASIVQDRMSSAQPSGSIPYDPYHEMLYHVCLLYTEALANCIPLAQACKNLNAKLPAGSPTIPERIASHLEKTGSVSCWGSMSGVLLWSSLVVGAAAYDLEAAYPLRRTEIKNAARWMRITGLYCMILISTEQAACFLECCKNFLRVQKVLRGAKDPAKR